MATNNNVIYDALKSQFEAQKQKALATLTIYLTNPVGIGEHPDIMGAIEEELAKCAEYHEKYEMLGEILMGSDIDG